MTTDDGRIKWEDGGDEQWVCVGAIDDCVTIDVFDGGDRATLTMPVDVALRVARLIERRARGAR